MFKERGARAANSATRPPSLYATGHDKFSLKTDAYSMKTDAFSKKTDAKSKKTDAYSKKTDAKSKKTDVKTVKILTRLSFVVNVLRENR